MNTPYPPPPGGPVPGAHTGTGNAPGTGNVRQTVDSARQDAAGRVEGIAGSIDAAAAHLDEIDMARLSGYVHDMAGSLSGLAHDLRTKSGDEVLQQVNRLARENPALFIGGSIAMGFGLSRFARASQSRPRGTSVVIREVEVAPAAATVTPTSGMGDLS